MNILKIQKNILGGFMLIILFVLNSGFALASGKVSANAVDQPGPYFAFGEVQPGAGLNAVMSVANPNKEEASFYVYVVDAIVNGSGDLSMRPKNADKVGIGQWGGMGMSKITLAAGEVREVPFYINVPEDVVPGDYYGGVVVETMPSTVQMTSGGFVPIGRMAMNVTLSVPGEVVVDFGWDDFSHHVTEDGQHQALLVYSNNGNVSVESVLNMVVSTGGKVLEEIEVDLGLIMAGEKATRTLNFNSEDYPFWGSVDIEAKITYERASMFGNEQYGEEILQKTMSISVLPPTYAFAIAIGVVVLIPIIIMIFIHLKKRAKKYSFSYTVQDGETIQSIADKFRVKWEKIAKMNDVKSPFVIRSGQELIIPAVPKLFMQAMEACDKQQ